jgi:hypothetical protein
MAEPGGTWTMRWRCCEGSLTAAGCDPSRAGYLCQSTVIGYLPCPVCGALLSSGQRSTHVCDPDETVLHQVVKARVQLARFEEEVARFLATAHGRFALFLAKRQRDGGATP